jgi:hypothetical protein
MPCCKVKPLVESMYNGPIPLALKCLDWHLIAESQERF